MLKANLLQDDGKSQVTFENKVNISSEGIVIKSRNRNRIPYNINNLQTWTSDILFTFIKKNAILVAFGATITLIKEGRCVYLSMYNQRDAQKINGDGYLTGIFNSNLPTQFIPQNNYTDVINKLNWYSINDKGNIASANNNAVLRFDLNDNNEWVLTIQRTNTGTKYNIIGVPLGTKFDFTFNDQRFNMNTVTGNYLAVE